MLNLKVNITFDGILHDASKELPEAGKFVLAFVENSSVPIRAKYVPKFSLEPYDQDDWCEYNEENDTYYCPEGWYECNKYDEINWLVHDKVIAWCELPSVDLS